jgi:hypothetical protein
VGCDGGVARVDRRVSGVKPWSPEEPNLYTLRVELLGERGLLDMVEERVGFRSFKVVKGRIYLNGKPIYLKGFGRHEDFPITGKHVPGAALVRDFFLLKKLGASALHVWNFADFRTPQSPRKDGLEQEGSFHQGSAAEARGASHQGSVLQLAQPSSIPGAGVKVYTHAQDLQRTVHAPEKSALGSLIYTFAPIKELRTT